MHHGFPVWAIVHDIKIVLYTRVNGSMYSEYSVVVVERLIRTNIDIATRKLLLQLTRTVIATLSSHPPNLFSPILQLSILLSTLLIILVYTTLYYTS